MIPLRLCKNQDCAHFLAAAPSTCCPHPGPNPMGLPVGVYCLEWRVTFAVIVLWCLWHRTTPFHRPINSERRQPLRVLSYFLTRETEGRITKLPTKQSLMSCNYNKEQWLSRPQPTHTGIEAPGRAPQRAGLALGPTGKIQIGLRIFSGRFWLEPTPCDTLVLFYMQHKV